MNRAVTQQDIADACGVDRTTVSAILDPRKRVQFNPATQARVLDAAGALGYRPDLAAQLMRGKKSGTIGIISSAGLVQPSLEKLLLASQEIHEAGYGIVSGELLWSQDALSRAADNMLDVRVEGVILAGLSPGNGCEELEGLRKAGIPMVALGGTPPPDTPWVSIDGRSGMRDLTSHVLSRGCRLLVHATTVSSGAEKNASISLLDRIAGFQDAAEAAGLDDAQAIVLYAEDASPVINDFKVGRSMVQRALELPQRPDAILCSNDQVALSALTVCAEAGLRVPQDVAITGFDNTDMAGYTRPPLTSVAQPSEACAKKAVELLLRRVRGETLQPAEFRNRVPCEIVIRDSA